MSSLQVSLADPTAVIFVCRLLTARLQINAAVHTRAALEGKNSGVEEWNLLSVVYKQRIALRRASRRV